MSMATKNDNKKVIEPDVVMIGGTKTIIDPSCKEPSFKNLSDAEFMKIMGVVK